MQRTGCRVGEPDAELDRGARTAGAAVQVNTTTSTLSEVVDQARMVELPLNGRDAARLATLVPGMQVISVSSESGKSIRTTVPAPGYAPSPTVTGATNMVSDPVRTCEPIVVRLLFSPS